MNYRAKIFSTNKNNIMNLQITIAQLGSTTGYAIINIYDPTAPNAVLDSQNVALPITGTAIVNFANVSDQTYVAKTFISPDTNWQHGTQIGDAFYAYPGISNTAVLRNDLVLVADNTSGFASGQSQYIDTSLAGWTYSVEFRGTGTLIDGTDIKFYNTGGWGWINGYKIQPGEVYILHFQPNVSTSSSTTTANPKGNLFDGYEILTADVTLTAADMGKIIMLQGANPLLSVTLPDPTTIADGKLTCFLCNGGSQVMASLLATTQINWLKKSLTAVHLGQCEEIWLYKIGSTWYVAHSEGNFKTVGQYVEADVLDDINCFMADGGTFLRTNYPRITYFVLNRLDPSMVVTDTDWNLQVVVNGVTTYPNHGKWSLGDGSSTLRRPLRMKKKDVNGNFIDSGFMRAVDGNTEKAGVYQKDQVGNFFADIQGYDAQFHWSSNTGERIIALGKAAGSNMPFYGNESVPNIPFTGKSTSDGITFTATGETAPSTVGVYRLIRY